MSLTEKFIEVNDWTVSRKTALFAGGIAAPGHAILLVVGHLLLAPLDWIDVGPFDLMASLMLLDCALVGAVAWVVARTGAEGRWVYHLWGVSYSALSAGMIYLFGAPSTALLSWYPAAIIAVAIWYDARIAWTAFGYGAIGVSTCFALPAAGLVDYAPAVEGRDFSLQSAPGFAIAMAFFALVYFVVAFSCVMLVVQARARQQTRLDDAHRQLGKATSLISRYVPAELAADIMAGHDVGQDGYARRKLSVFFSDLVGFSDIAEELEPEDLALVLNEYFAEMTAIAHRHHGTVDELQGDALLILFGAPHATTDKEHALNAVRMAGEMHEAMQRLNDQWREAGITETLAVRMGINTGVVTIGHFGTPERMKYAALGKHVNIAARLQAACEHGRTVLSYSTYLLVKDQVECRPLGPLQLKGIHKPVEAFEVS